MELICAVSNPAGGVVNVMDEKKPPVKSGGFFGVLLRSFDQAAAFFLAGV